MKRIFILGLFSILMLSFIYFVGYSYNASNEEANVSVDTYQATPIIPSEMGVFERSKFALDYTNMPVDEKHQRSLETYYNNRAFHGAPPSIPHPVSDERNMGEKSCLKCHRNGGFVKKYEAYAPVTPHANFINCRQCHVPQLTDDLFKESNWVKVAAPSVGNGALTGSPPIIPHQIQLHENCLACHAGSAAPKEIKVTHPERINCRQCHAVNNKETVDIGDFIR